MCIRDRDTYMFEQHKKYTQEVDRGDQYVLANSGGPYASQTRGELAPEFKNIEMCIRDRATAGALTRVPCSVSYQFLIRNNRLHVIYYIQHSDFLGQLLSTTKEVNKEKFYMTPLKAPISAENYTEDEAKDVEACTIDCVYEYSVYARI